MISCKEFLAHLGSYLEGDLAVAVGLEVERHLAACPTCRVLVDSSKKTITILTDTGRVDVTGTLPEPVISRIMERIRAMPRRPS